MAASMTGRVGQAVRSWRRTESRIERTSGLRESAIHAPMMTEISVPLLLTLLCEVNPLPLGISTAAAGADEATAIWDLRSTAAELGRHYATLGISWRSLLLAVLAGIVIT